MAEFPGGLGLRKRARRPIIAAFTVSMALLDGSITPQSMERGRFRDADGGP